MEEYKNQSLKISTQVCPVTGRLPHPRTTAALGSKRRPHLPRRSIVTTEVPPRPPVRPCRPAQQPCCTVTSG